MHTAVEAFDRLVTLHRDAVVSQGCLAVRGGESTLFVLARANIAFSH